jgi:hypothetical protein
MEYWNAGSYKEEAFPYTLNPLFHHSMIPLFPSMPTIVNFLSKVQLPLEILKNPEISDYTD